MQFFEEENVIASISENNSLAFYEIHEDENEKDQILKLWTKEYKQTILYDLIHVILVFFKDSFYIFFNKKISQQTKGKYFYQEKIIL